MHTSECVHIYHVPVEAVKSEKKEMDPLEPELQLWTIKPRFSTTAVSD